MRKLSLRNAPWVAPVASVIAQRYVGSEKPIDIQLGFRLMRDRRVPVSAKLSALAVGVATVALIDLLEFPLEAVLAVLMPVIGLGINVAVDGAEYVAGSLLLAAAIIPRLASKAIVEQVRAEWSGRPIAHL